MRKIIIPALVLLLAFLAGVSAQIYSAQSYDECKNDCIRTYPNDLASQEQCVERCAQQAAAQAAAQPVVAQPEVAQPAPVYPVQDSIVECKEQLRKCVEAAQSIEEKNKCQEQFYVCVKAPPVVFPQDPLKNCIEACEAKGKDMELRGEPPENIAKFLDECKRDCGETFKPVPVPLPTPVPVPFELHYKCYEIEELEHNETLPEVVVTDQFGWERLRINKSELLCTPARKRLEKPVLEKPTPPAPVPQCEEQLRKCVEAAKSIVEAAKSIEGIAKCQKQFEECVKAVQAQQAVQQDSPVVSIDVSKQAKPLPPVQAVGKERHWKCYLIEEIERKAEYPIVVVDDQFGTERLRIIRPRYLCTPADKSLSGVPPPRPPPPELPPRLPPSKTRPAAIVPEGQIEESVRELPREDLSLLIAEIMLRLEEFRVRLDKLARRSRSIADYYKSVGENEKAKIYSEVEIVALQLVGNVDALKNEISATEDPKEISIKIKEGVANIREQASNLAIKTKSSPP